MQKNLFIAYNSELTYLRFANSVEHKIGW